MKDEELMLAALGKERQQLHDKIMHIDRLIKKIRNGEYTTDANVISIDTPAIAAIPVSSPIFPKNAELKIQILRVFDFIGKASKLQDIQTEYDKLNEGHYPLRDTIRSLQGSKLLVMIKLKNAARGFLWVKRDWIENGQLLPEYKPEGFDMLYKAENLIFE
jgi:hypothetical protein